MASRRDFLKMSSLASTAICFPQLLQFGWNPEFNGKRLVVIQLSGGNDGLNTIIPYTNDIYYRERPKLAIPASEVIKLNDTLGLNPNMKALQPLFENGEMSIINGVGYPNPSRSHFRSMDIWHTATNADEYANDGWLGKWAANQTGRVPAIELSELLSLAMKSKDGGALAISNLKQLQRTKDDKLMRAIGNHAHDHHADMADYLYQTARQVTEGADYLSEKIDRLDQSKNYPNTALGKDLNLTAGLIGAGCETQVYYSSIGGFDTHAGQKPKQNRLLLQTSNALAAFAKDLQSKDAWKDTLVMVFSEFGRRLRQNGSGGTDHGQASNVWLLGGGLKNPGIVNQLPSLEKLNRGDLNYTTDFRDIYAGILDHWLDTPHATILGQTFNPIAI